MVRKCQMLPDLGVPKIMPITEHFCIKVLEEPSKFFLRRKGVNLEAIFDAEPDAGLLCMFHNFGKPVGSSRIIIKFSTFSDCFLPPVQILLIRCFSDLQIIEQTSRHFCHWYRSEMQYHSFCFKLSRPIDCFQ